MPDFRLPVPGTGALPAWRRNPAFAGIGLSPDSIAALDESEVVEAEMAERLRQRTQAHRDTILGQNAQIAQRHAEQQRAAQMSVDDLRADLRDAIDSHADAARRATEADRAVVRATEAVATAQSHLERFNDVDARVAEYTRDRLRSGMLAVLPANLIAQRADQHAAQEMLAATRAASVQLEAEATTARLLVETMVQRRDRAAVAVISRWCDGLAGEIEQAHRRLHDLRQRLLSASALWLPLAGVTMPLPVSDRVRASLRRQEDRPLLDEQVKAATRQWFLDLQADAAATMIGE